ncbi:unnamed protein product [Amaranthus hypochondriacus]
MGRWAAYRLLRRLTSFSPPSSVLPYTFQLPSLPPLSSDPTTQFHHFKFKPFSSSASSSSAALSQDFDYGFRDFSHNYVEDDDETAKIPVKAYFLSTSINLRSMQAENAGNVVPPTSRTSNYVTFRFCSLPSEMIGMGVENSVICNRYMVVFQYGSAVLFNVEDHEIDFFLNIARKHASGLLPEMRKDGWS